MECSNKHQLGRKKEGNYKANSGSFKKGCISLMKGKKTSEDAKQKQREAKLKNPVKYWLGKKRENLSNEKNYGWKGEQASYVPIHTWVRRHKGIPKKCSKCGKEGKRIHWSNKDHKYKRRLEDYQALCAKCHKEYDLKYNAKK